MLPLVFKTYTSDSIYLEHEVNLQEVSRTLSSALISIGKKFISDEGCTQFLRIKGQIDEMMPNVGRRCKDIASIALYFAKEV